MPHDCQFDPTGSTCAGAVQFVYDSPVARERKLCTKHWVTETHPHKCSAKLANGSKCGEPARAYGSPIGFMVAMVHRCDAHREQDEDAFHETMKNTPS